MSDLYLKMLLTLFLVLALLGLFYMLIKKKLSINNRSSLFHIIEYRSFGPKTGLMAIRFQDKVLLLGITQTNITMIGQFEAMGVLSNDGEDKKIAEKIKLLKECLNESD